MIQQNEKRAYFRHKTQRLVILIPSFITTKMAAYQFALWEPTMNASTALQGLERTRHSLHLVSCSDIRGEL